MIKLQILRYLSIGEAINFSLSKLENFFSVNWLNPIATLYLNFRCFPIKQAVHLPIFVYGMPRFYNLSGRMKIEGEISMGVVRFNQVKTEAPSNSCSKAEICNYGLIIFRGKGYIGTGCKIVVGHNKILDIGENFRITDFCNIGCYAGISIGAQSWIVHRCQILDSNYHYVADFEKGIVPRYSKPIHIGRGCWICNTTTITGGTVLPDFTIVASNSLVGKDYSDIPESSMIGGIPAKFIRTGFRRIDNSQIERKIDLFYKENPESVFEIPEDDTPEEYSFIDLD